MDLGSLRALSTSTSPLARAALTSYDETPLHVALMLGHLDFAKFVVTHKPDMAIEVDSQGRSPLHFAAANGYVEMVNVLESVNPNVFFFGMRMEEPISI